MTGDDTVTIARSAAEIFDTLVDGEQNVHWRTNVVGCTRLSGDGGPGTEWQMARRSMGRNHPRDYVVEAYEYPMEFAVRYVAGHGRGVVTYTLTEREGVTEVALHIDVRPGRFRLMSASVPGEIGTELDDLQRLRAYLERRDQEAASPS